MAKERDDSLVSKEEKDALYFLDRAYKEYVGIATRARTTHWTEGTAREDDPKSPVGRRKAIALMVAPANRIRKLWDNAPLDELQSHGFVPKHPRFVTLHIEIAGASREITLDGTPESHSMAKVNLDALNEQCADEFLEEVLEVTKVAAALYLYVRLCINGRGVLGPVKDSDSGESDELKAIAELRRSYERLFGFFDCFALYSRAFKACIVSVEEAAYEHERAKRGGSCVDWVGRGEEMIEQDAAYLTADLVKRECERVFKLWSFGSEPYWPKAKREDSIGHDDAGRVLEPIDRHWQPGPFQYVGLLEGQLTEIMRKLDKYELGAWGRASGTKGKSLTTAGKTVVGHEKKHEKQHPPEQCLQALSEVLRRAGLHVPSIIGESEAILQVWPKILAASKSDASVLISGEPGTGKELVAELIHAASRRREKPYNICNCAALSDTLLESELFGHVKGAFTGADRDKLGLFRASDGCTLFLDEVGDMSLRMQAAILRALDPGFVRPMSVEKEIKVDVRIIAATNKNIQDEVKNGGFRTDLLSRLQTPLQIHLPPLRDRLEDIPLLVEYFAKRRKPKPEWIEELKKEASAWPGNVRSLHSEVDAALAQEKDVWQEVSEDTERDNIVQALRNHNTKIAAANALGISHTTFYKKLKEHSISKDEGQRR